MSYLIIFLFTLLSCFLFDKIGVYPILRSLTQSYKEQMAVMTAKDISDEERQKKLLALIPGQLMALLKLIGSILLFISPFFAYIALAPYSSYFDTPTLYSIWGIGISLVAVVLYIMIKKRYGVHKDGEGTS